MKSKRSSIIRDGEILIRVRAQSSPFLVTPIVTTLITVSIYREKLEFELEQSGQVIMEPTLLMELF
jgi:hypothetical protein